MKKVYVIVILFFAFWSIVISSLSIVSLNKSSQITMFYGDTCPHCKVLEKFIDDNNLEEKVKIDKKEVFNDRENAFELQSVASECGINKDEVGVPLIYYKGRCYIGDNETINFMKTFVNGECK